MAGCEPRHLTTVLASTECLLHTDFNAHGVSATTMGATPCTIVSGPVRTAAGLNSGMGALGSGTRANAAIGRAVKLVLQNVGGARLGGTYACAVHDQRSSYLSQRTLLLLPLARFVSSKFFIAACHDDTQHAVKRANGLFSKLFTTTSACVSCFVVVAKGMRAPLWASVLMAFFQLVLHRFNFVVFAKGTESTTLGTPMKFTMCVAEAEEVAPAWAPYHADQWGTDPTKSAVTMLAVVSGPHQVSLSKPKIIHQ
jgi:hypothetical protein